MNPVVNNKEMNVLHNLFRFCIRPASSPALNFLKKVTGNVKVRIIVAASTETSIFVSICDVMTFFAILNNSLETTTQRSIIDETINKLILLLSITVEKKY